MYDTGIGIPSHHISDCITDTIPLDLSSYRWCPITIRFVPQLTIPITIRRGMSSYSYSLWLSVDLHVKYVASIDGRRCLNVSHIKLYHIVATRTWFVHLWHFCFAVGFHQFFIISEVFGEVYKKCCSFFVGTLNLPCFNKESQLAVMI